MGNEAVALNLCNNDLETCASDLATAKDFEDLVVTAADRLFDVTSFPEFDLEAQLDAVSELVKDLRAANATCQVQLRAGPQTTSQPNGDCPVFVPCKEAEHLAALENIFSKVDCPAGRSLEQNLAFLSVFVDQSLRADSAQPDICATEPSNNTPATEAKAFFTEGMYEAGFWWDLAASHPEYSMAAASLAFGAIFTIYNNAHP